MQNTDFQNTISSISKMQNRSEPMEKSDIETLIRRSKLVKSSLARELMAFSRSGFTEGARRCADSNDVVLYTLKDVSRPTGKQ